MADAMKPQADVWKSPDLVRTFLEGVRGGIPYAADQIDIMVQVVNAASRRISRFLDLGSGAGTLAAALLAAHPGAEAVLADFSEPMLEAARRVFPSPPHTLLQCDFNDPQWSDAFRDLAPFDAVVSGYAIHHSPDDTKRSIYAAIFDLLAPGGVFVNIEHVKPATPWVGSLNDALFVDTIHAHHQRIGSGKSRDKVAEEYVFRPDKQANILAPVEEQCDWLRTIGFQDVDCYFKVFELAVFGGRRPE
ncbi:MAG: class I SAM-dependent methyltransferase [Planctomycetaceae bacterium]